MILDPMLPNPTPQGDAMKRFASIGACAWRAWAPLLERMNLDRHTALGLGLAFISLFLVVGGVGASLVTGLKVLRLLGLTIGGTAAIPTLLLCLYYLAILKIRTRGVTIATVASGTVAFVFVLFMVALFSGHPTLHRWATYAF